MTFDDLLTWARTVWAEARGEGAIGMLAVAHVIRNRANDPGKDWWGDTIAEVCLKPWQFSCWNHSDPNRAKLMNVKLDDAAFQVAMRVCLEAMTNPVGDPTGGADHYHTMAVQPKWANGRKPIAAIGNHLFYRLGSGS